MKIDFIPDPSLYPFQPRWFDSHAGQMHYIDEGDGLPILFCHGNPAWSFLYRNIVTRLRGRFRCVAVDYLGFGLSERSDGFGYTIEEHARCIGELVDHLNLDGFLTMGRDWGGPVAMAVGIARAERVRGVTLRKTWFWPPTSFDETVQQGHVQALDATADRDDVTRFRPWAWGRAGTGRQGRAGLMTEPRR